MKDGYVKLTLEMPERVYQGLKVQASAKGMSIREFILSAVRAGRLPLKHRTGKRIKFPIIRSVGPKVDLTNEQIYGHIVFP